MLPHIYRWISRLTTPFPTSINTPVRRIWKSDLRPSTSRSVGYGNPTYDHQHPGPSGLETRLTIYFYESYSFLIVPRIRFGRGSIPLRPSRSTPEAGSPIPAQSAGARIRIRSCSSCSHILTNLTPLRLCVNNL